MAQFRNQYLINHEQKTDFLEIVFFHDCSHDEINRLNHAHSFLSKLIIIMSIQNLRE